MQLLWIHSAPQWCPAYGKMCTVFGKINHYKEVSGTGRKKSVQSIDPHVEQHQDEDNTEKVNINSIYIDSIKQQIISHNSKFE